MSELINDINNKLSCNQNTYYLVEDEFDKQPVLTIIHKRIHLLLTTFIL